MRVATVVGREIPHQAHTTAMGGSGQSRHGRIAAEERIDLRKRRGVVAMIRLGREERRQIDRADTERREVIEVGRDAIQVTAIELPRRIRAFTDHGIIPRGRPRPGRRRPVNRFGETIREDLVHRARGPRRRRFGCAEPEVGGVGNIVVVQALAVEPLITVGAAVHQPAIADDGVADAQLRAQPEVVLVLCVNPRLNEFRLTINDHARPRCRDIAGARHPQPDRDRATQRRIGLRNIQRRAVMMRQRPGLIDRHGTPLGGQRTAANRATTLRKAYLHAIDQVPRSAGRRPPPVRRA